MKTNTCQTQRGIKSREVILSGKPESVIKFLIQENIKPQDLIVYTDGSVTKDQSGWGFTVIVSSMEQPPSTKTVQPIPYTISTYIYNYITSSFTHALHWIAQRGESDHTWYHLHKFNELATKSQKVEWEAQTGMCPNLWVYCPGHAGAKGNDRADRLAGNAETVTSGVSEDLKC